MDIVTVILGIVSILGTGISIYQFAVINESKKRRSELQFLLAGLHQLALSKQLEWQNQINLLPRLQNERDLELFRVHARGRDSCMEISSVIVALEGVIDVDTSAVNAMLKKSIENSELLNKLRASAQKPSALPQEQGPTSPPSKEEAEAAPPDAEPGNEPPN